MAIVKGLFQEAKQRQSAREIVKGSVIDTLKGVGRSMVGATASEYSPGLESDLIKRASAESMNLGRKAVDAFGVPSTPNANVFGVDVNPNSVASFLAGSAIDPRALAGYLTPVVGTASGAAEGLLTGSNIARKFAASKSGALDRLIYHQASTKGRAVTSRLLPALDVATDVEANRPVSALVEGSQIIKKTSKPQHIVDKFRNEQDVVVGQIESLVKQNVKEISPEYVMTRARLILLKQIKNSNPAERKKLAKAFADEWRWINEQRGMDTIKAHNRKKFLYDRTEGIQKRQRKGLQIVTAPEQGIADDAFAQAYKEIVEQTHPDIHKLNSRWYGLESGKKAAAKLVETTLEHGNIAQRVATQIAGRPSMRSVTAAAVREIPIIKQSVSRMTGEIERLNKKASEALVRSRLKQAPRLLEPNSQYFREILGPDDLATLPGPANIPHQKLLPAGQGFEMVSPEESIARLRLEKFIENFEIPFRGHRKSVLKFDKKEKEALNNQLIGRSHTGWYEVKPSLRVHNQGIGSMETKAHVKKISRRK